MGLLVRGCVGADVRTICPKQGGDRRRFLSVRLVYNALMRLWWLLVLTCAACGGAASPAADEPTPAPWEVALTRKGTTEVRWRPAGGPLPFNEPFSLEVELRDPETDAPVAGAEVVARCEMPAHGHGMNVEPLSVEVGEGRYRVDGMLLHMTGDWVLALDVIRDGSAEAVTFPLTLALE